MSYIKFYRVSLIQDELMLLPQVNTTPKCKHYDKHPQGYGHLVTDVNQ